MSDMWKSRAVEFLGEQAAPPTYRVLAHWDSEAQVWWAESDEVPGLVAEAASHDELVQDLRVLVPQMLALNVPDHAQKPFLLSVISDQVEVLTTS